MKKNMKKIKKYEKKYDKMHKYTPKTGYSAHEHAQKHAHMSDICCLYFAHAWVYLGGVGCVSVVGIYIYLSKW